MCKKTSDSGLWAVTHLAFATDHLIHTTSAVKAETAQEAMDIFNALAKKRLNYPYFWSYVELENIEPLEIITKETE